jgi:hypothetical protein
MAIVVQRLFRAPMFSLFGGADTSAPERMCAQRSLDHYTGLGNKFRQAFWLLTWLLGLALIIYGAPLYRTLPLDDREQVAGFRPNTHELITVGRGRPLGVTEFWQFLPKPLTRLLPLDEKRRYGDSIYLRDLDSGTRQRLDFALGSVYALTCCKRGERLCVMFGPDRIQTDDEDFRVAVVDIRTGQPIRVVHRVDPSSMSVSDDGKVLLYFRKDNGRKLGTCIEVDSGKILYDHDAVEDGFLSPLGNRLAIATQEYGFGRCTQTIIDLKPRSLVNEITTKPTDPIEPGFSRDWPFKPNYYWQGLSLFPGLCPRPMTTSAFSPDERHFLDLDGNLRDSATKEFYILEGSMCPFFRMGLVLLWQLDLILKDLPIARTTGPTVFADNGKKLAWVESQIGRTAIRWRDIEKQCDLDDRTTWIADSPTFGIDTADAAGKFVHVFAARWENRETWRHKMLRWLGFRRAPLLDVSHEWLLFDGGSGSVLRRGDDYLLAVSSDGRYAVSGSMEQSRVKIHELPLHRSIQFMVIGTVAWTVLLDSFRRWFRRRLKPLFVDVSDSIERTASS